MPKLAAKLGIRWDKPAGGRTYRRCTNSLICSRASGGQPFRRPQQEPIQDLLTRHLYHNLKHPTPDPFFLHDLSNTKPVLKGCRSAELVMF
jgi:hypothetical protein